MPRRNEPTQRKCIATGELRPVGELLRFVADPQGELVVDLRHRLPGRGAWVSANREAVELARGKKLFSRALKMPVAISGDLAGKVDARLVDAFTGALSLTRRAGELVNGFSRVEAAVLAGRAAAVLHADDAALDGVRKIHAAIRRCKSRPAGTIVIRALNSDQLSMAFGGRYVIHAALLEGQASGYAIRCALALERFRGSRRVPVVETGHDTDPDVDASETDSQD